MEEITPKLPSYIFGYYKPKDEMVYNFDAYREYVKDISLAKYGADTVGKYITQASNEQITAINDVGGKIEQGYSILSGQLDNIMSSIDTTNEHLYFINQNLNLQLEQQRISNLLLENISNLLRLPENEKQRYHHIESGLRFLANSKINEDVFEDALEELLAAEQLMKQDYFVLHRIGLIFLFVDKYLDPIKAREYFKRAGKYASIETDPKAKKLVSILRAHGSLNLANISGKATEPQSEAGIEWLAADSYEKAAFASYLIGDFQEAVNLCEKANHYLPSAQTFFSLAKYQVRNGMISAAIKNLDIAIDMLPELAGACFREIDLLNEIEVIKLLEVKNTKCTERLHAIKAIVVGGSYKSYNNEYIRVIDEAIINNYSEKIKVANKLEPLMGIDNKLLNLINNLLISDSFPNLFELDKTQLREQLISIINSTSYDEKLDAYENAIERTKLAIGAKYRDGLIFYLDKSNIHGLMCLEPNLIGSWEKASKYCRELSKGGLTMWHLPSIEEAELICKVISKDITPGTYWTSKKNYATLFGDYKKAYVFNYPTGKLDNIEIYPSNVTHIIAVHEF